MPADTLTGFVTGDHRLPREFYAHDTLAVARAMLGKLLVRRSPEGITAGRIVETEAYIGPGDRGAHSYGGRRTKRTAVMYGPPGVAYVYLVYGIYHCFNAVTAEAGRPEAVLVRAIEPVLGQELMARRRGRAVPVRALGNGPGKLCLALGIDASLSGVDLEGDALYLADDGRVVPDTRVGTTPRINIGYAGPDRDLPWRFVIEGHPCLSAR
ncbi:MAG TPA: DNA-3-methyladenine glycosylase [Bacillota bacterium]|nr:DNA-3-methyladenine glycosylase [Bacillota bacterium]